MKNRPFFYIGLIGLLTIAATYVMEITFPKTAPFMAKGFSKPIIFFEFIQSPIEVEAFVGINDYDFDSETFIKKLDLGNKIDFVFAFIYTTFFFLMFYKLAKVSNLKWYKIGMILAVIALVCDVVENIQLLEITNKITTGDYINNLHLLFIFTWIKWFSIAIGFALFSLWLVKMPGVLRYMGYLAWLPLMLGIMAYVNRGLLNELFTRSINIMFFVAISYCFMYHNNMKPLLSKENN